jgi:predicted RNase H-like HicB family nuclease
MRYTVNVGFDDAEHRYYVIGSDIPGLHVETDTFEEFVEVVQDVAPDLLGAAASGAKIKFEREIAVA